MSGLDPNNIPENIRKCMPAETRKELKAPTMDEAAAKVSRQEELKMHRDFEQWLRLNEVPFVHSRTDRKATTAKGTPDFVLLWGGKGCAIELKGPGGKLTEEQAKTLKAWEAKKVPCIVATDLATAIGFAMSTLETNGPKGTSE